MYWSLLLYSNKPLINFANSPFTIALRLTIELRLTTTINLIGGLSVYDTIRLLCLVGSVLVISHGADVLVLGTDAVRPLGFPTFLTSAYKFGLGVR